MRVWMSLWDEWLPANVIEPLAIYVCIYARCCSCFRRLNTVGLLCFTAVLSQHLQNNAGIIWSQYAYENRKPIKCLLWSRVDEYVAWIRLFYVIKLLYIITVDSLKHSISRKLKNFHTWQKKNYVFTRLYRCIGTFIQPYHGEINI